MLLIKIIKNQLYIILIKVTQILFKLCGFVFGLFRGLALAGSGGAVKKSHLTFFRKPVAQRLSHHKIHIAIIQKPVIGKSSNKKLLL